MLNLPKELEPYREQIETSRQEYVKIQAIQCREDELTLTQSKLGGYPYMPEGFEYPLDSKEEMMMLLIQINFAEVPRLEGYPTEGILQFFVADDDSLGMDYSFSEDDIDLQHNYRVIYHPNVDTSDSRRTFIDVPVLSQAEFELTPNAHSLEFEKKVGYVPLMGADCWNILHEHILHFAPEITDDQARQRIRYAYYNAVDEPMIWHKIGGYAHTIQEDIRIGYNPKLYLGDHIQLLQITSENSIMWGDGGAAHFFIDPSDLRRRDFSKVVYFWSCS